MGSDAQLAAAINSSPLVGLFFLGLGLFGVFKAPLMVETQKSLGALWYDEKYDLWMVRLTGATLAIFGMLRLFGIL